MLHARILYIAALLGALLFHTYYTGWFSWYLLMLAVILPCLGMMFFPIFTLYVTDIYRKRHDDTE